MKVLKAVVIQGVGPDKVFLKTDLPSATWPYAGNFQDLHFDVAKGDGKVYVMNNWPGIEVEVIVLSSHTIPYSQ